MDIANSKESKLTMKGNFGYIYKVIQDQIIMPGFDNVYITNISNYIQIFSSLQKPKMIQLYGSDGKIYSFIVKSNDDMRKDSRFIELGKLLNKLFANSTNYYIRTYDVIPFGGSGGIMRFVSNLISLKEIFIKYNDGSLFYDIYKRNSKKQRFGSVKSFIETRYSIEPFFQKYFLEKYNDPKKYYECSNNYLETYTVMCVVGYFMGLGDRHCENILFDKETGDTVHVDLNMIFNLGQSLQIPEKVPFRLTQNIIDGFGVMKLKLFKKIFKEVLLIMAQNKDTILANLLSFVNDPVLITKSGRSQSTTTIMNNLNERLSNLDEDYKLEQKVDELINEATSDKNLSEMFIGWASYI
ncbi:ATR [Hepatospora eriocheir]|uniref:ATR n=1 Tax=Hepatospora eriocheir TaxID=1081669 RepID=A0A1X0QD49_9MICR|nr:ATR [Hepatospora eriocheir]